jgi:MerR family transcriptional regulator, light-induced transcriptional regulator
MSTPVAEFLQKIYIGCMNYSVKAAAIATGVSGSRLRTWERRYGVPTPKRSASGRRVYDEKDLQIIRRMAALVDAGVPASDAASAVLAEPVSEAPPAVPEHPAVQELVQAARSYDGLALVAAVRESVEDLGWAAAADQVLMPGLKRMGEEWSADRVSCANEHFASEIIRLQVAAALAALPDADPSAPAVLLACPEDERHEIGLLILSLLLRERGLRVYYLGADVPAGDLQLAAARTNADALCLSATLPGSVASLGRTARRLINARLSARLFVGGPAFSADGALASTVPGTRLPRSLEEAAKLIDEQLRPP